jgi:(S)-ureidoglycine aminohydrolase
MKSLLILALLMSAQSILAQNPLAGSVFHLYDLPKVEDENRIFRQIFRNQSTEFVEKISIHHSTLKPGHKLRQSHAQEVDEELIIIQEGELTVTLDGETKTLGPGSVLVIFPKSDQMMNNLSKSNVSYYVLIYKSKSPRALSESVKSVMYDWQNLVFRPHDKGGRRDVFDRPTTMFSRMEMHVTTLNQGLKSHEPHKHLAEEIILVKDGKVSMQIDGQTFEGGKGDLFFLPSNKLHNLTNIGSEPTTYFAFQFN